MPGLISAQVDHRPGQNVCRPGPGAPSLDRLLHRTGSVVSLAGLSLGARVDVIDRAIRRRSRFGPTCRRCGRPHGNRTAGHLNPLGRSRIGFFRRPLLASSDRPIGTLPWCSRRHSGRRRRCRTAGRLIGRIACRGGIHRRGSRSQSDPLQQIRQPGAD